MSEATEGTGTAGSAESAGAGTEPTTTETTATQSGGNSGQYDRLMERMEQLGGHTMTVAEQLQAIQQQLNQEPEDVEDYLEEGDPGYEEQQFEQYLDKLVADRVEQGVREAVTPLQQARQAEVYDTRASDIESKFTDLMDDKGKPTELAASVMRAAWESAERFGINSDSDPRFWDVFEMSYKAHKADQIRGRETAAGQTSAVLESGGASAGSQGAAEVDELQGVRAILARSQSDPFA